MTNPGDEYEEFYRRNEAFYHRLLAEVNFVIDQALKSMDIRIHSHGGRVKELSHALEKIQRKGYLKPTTELEDIVGYRVVCLFASDLDRISDIVKSNFVVIEEESRISGVPDPASFGYMSDHYICKLGSGYSGARYDSLGDIRFEVQCTTILMDAWANVSHYLDYKGNASIPEHLRRDFYALSGLFYVADKHFELFFGTAADSANRVLSKAASGELDDDSVNAETVQALLQQLYPARRKSNLSAVSEFVEEIVPAGYTSIKELETKLQDSDDVLRRAMAAVFPAIENTNRMAVLDQVNAARMTLRMRDRRFSNLMPGRRAGSKRYSAPDRQDDQVSRDVNDLP